MANRIDSPVWDPWVRRFDNFFMGSNGPKERDPYITIINGVNAEEGGPIHAETLREAITHFEAGFLKYADPHKKLIWGQRPTLSVQDKYFYITASFIWEIF